MEISAPENVTVRFVLQTTLNSLKEQYEIFILGNIDELGSWCEY